jgi:hypothetical protein
MIRKFLVGAMVLGLTWCGAAYATGEAPPEAARLLARVRTLTAPDLAGRGSGTPEALAAADTLAAWLRAAGLAPGLSGGWFQEFALKGEGWTGEDLTGRKGRNVVGLFEGHGELAARYVVVGAHYDHLGRVAPNSAEYHPGANDNASGVSVVCELVAMVKARSSDATARRSILVVFFGGEEIGLQGSAHFVSAPPVPLSQVDAMLNFDTVGQIVDNRLYVSGVGTSPVLAELVTAANSGDLQLTLGQGGWSGSDHMSFNTREVPVLFVFGGPYPQYNRPSDTWQTLTLDGLVQVTAYSERLLERIRTTPGPLPWVMVADKLRADADPDATNRETWFGSLPDFTEEIQGYRLAGVFGDSPAARAGLQKGDVLVGMAGQEITDLASFTRILRTHAPGDLVEVEVLRDDSPLRFTVVLGNRADRK